jgi:hypothetical protein
MRALKQARKLIQADPGNPVAKVLSRLVMSLESDQPFLLSDIYTLSYEDFLLAMELIKEWRLDRYYASKVKLLDTSLQVSN